MRAPFDPQAQDGPEIAPPTGREVAFGFLLALLVLGLAFGALIWMTRGTDVPEEGGLPFGVAGLILFQNVGLLAAIIPLALARGIGAYHALGFLPVSGARLVGWAALVVLVAFLIRPLIALVQVALGQPVQAPGFDVVNRGIGADGLTAMLVVIAVAAPLAEEIAFRGLVFAWLRSRYSFWPAAIGQAIPFGLLHFTPEHAIYAALLGIALAMARERGRSLWVPLTAHILINTFAVLAIHLGVELPAQE